MKRTIIMMFLTSIFLSSLSSCVKESDDDAGGTATQAMAGEWWIQLGVNNELVVPTYFKILTYNTAENVSTKMWIDDLEDLWPFKIKMDVNPADKTFTANASASTYSDITVTLKNGK